MPAREKPTTPPGAAVCLTFDLDGHTMWTSRAAENAQRPAVLSSGDYDVGQGLDLVLETLAEHDLRTTFFVPTDVASAHEGAVRRIVGQDHEIAMHGDDHRPLGDRSRAAELEYLGRLKGELEERFQQPVRGYRAPLYDVTPQTRELLAELGCTYSSNYMDAVHPYVVASPAGRIVELPVHWMLDDGPYLLFSSHPPNHRQFVSNSQILEMWTDELRAIHDLGGTTVFTLHPQLTGRPSRLVLVRALIDAAQQLDEAWFPTMSQLAARVLETGG